MRGDGSPLPGLLDDGVGENYGRGKGLAFKISDLRGSMLHCSDSGYRSYGYYRDDCKYPR
jgi:hypothetical protein